MHPKDADGMANSVDPDQTASRSSLILVCTVCLDLSVPIHRICTVTLISSNHPCLEYIFMVPEVFEPLKFGYIYEYDSCSVKFIETL